jgi:hypothetical protein
VPRFSHTIHDDSGKAIGIVCGSTRHKKCSTPGCHGHADRLCDYPVQRQDPPKRGDARLHIERNVVFYVWSVKADAITISPSEPGSRRHGVLQTVTLAEWFTKSTATCDRPICARCAVRVGPDRDLCGAHARLEAK